MEEAKYPRLKNESKKIDSETALMNKIISDSKAKIVLYRSNPELFAKDIDYNKRAITDALRELKRVKAIENQQKTSFNTPDGEYLVDVLTTQVDCGKHCGGWLYETYTSCHYNLELDDDYDVQDRCKDLKDSYAQHDEACDKIVDMLKSKNIEYKIQEKADKD